MDQHKIDNFAKDHPGVTFPAYLHLEKTQAEMIRKCIAKAIDSPGSEGLALVRRLYAVSTGTIDLQADDVAFSVCALLRELGVACPKKVYLNWYRFDDIDQIDLAALDQYFSDIWYPGSDDLDVFDDSTDWIVSIAHFGKIRFFKKR